MQITLAYTEADFRIVRDSKNRAKRIAGKAVVAITLMIHPVYTLLSGLLIMKIQTYHLTFHG
jgi:hypothetical protein